MERVIKTTSRLNLFYSAHSTACPRRHVVPVNDIHPDTSRPGKFADKTSLDPSFLVPAIIDTLRANPRYREKSFIIPGEADAYCASDVAKHGGTILTSDSDLLAHDLGNGRVVFFRDIHENASSMLACTVYGPREIYTKLGLPKSVEACRLGYERIRSPNATLPMLLRACSGPIADAMDYDYFRQQYVHNEEAPIPPLIGGNLLLLNGLDPRVSELLLQIGQAPKIQDAQAKVKIFLPSLIENPSRGTSWDASAHVRKLAYTAAAQYLQCRCSISVEEYRRVQNVHQKGRDITPLPTDAANSAVNELLAIMRRLRETEIAPQHYWILLCLVLDIIECNQQGKNSHVLITLQQGDSNLTTSGDRISWDMIHFGAHIQAGYYSLRILNQVLSSVITGADSTEDLTLSFIELRGLLSELPSLAEFPDVCALSGFIKTTKQSLILQLLSEFITLEQSSPREGDAGDSRKERKKDKRGGKSHGVNKKPSKKANNANKGNMFNILSIDAQTARQ